MNILALDIGTSSVRAAVLDVETGKPTGPIARTPYDLERATPEAAEVPAERLWLAVTAAAREAVHRSHVAGTPGDVAGIGFSVMTPALVLVDKADKPLTPIWTHLDRRSRSVARQTWAAVGPSFLADTGNRPIPGGMSVLSYREMLNVDTYLGSDVRSYLHLNGWLGLRLTGEKAFDPANASFTGLFATMTERKWSPRWCEYFEIDPVWLPPVVSGDTTIGTARSAAAAELGVPAGIPVKLGTADTSCAMLAAGAGPGDLLHSVGTTHVLAAFAASPRPDARHLTRLFGVGDRYVHVTHNPVGGVAFDWLHRLCFRDQTAEEFFEKTIPAARKHRTRVTLDPPYLDGDRLEIEACRAAFRDLELTTDRMDLLAAMLEAMTRRHRDALASLGLEGKLGRVFLTGHGAEIARKLMKEYQAADVRMLDEAALFGVARLFQGPGHLK
jgi:xylulokinase